MPTVFTLSRRNLLKAGLTTTTGLLLPPWSGHDALAAEELHTLRYRLLRDTDLLNVEIRFINFRREKQLIWPLGLGQSLIAVILPPQNIAEAIFDEVHRDPNFENDPIL